jgi:hypothetical protein
MCGAVAPGSKRAALVAGAPFRRYRIHMTSPLPAPSPRSTFLSAVGCGVLAGVIINVIEWLAHRVWLDARWNDAFAALGKTPAFWGTFTVANFGVGVVALLAYRWLAGTFGWTMRSKLKISAAMWIIFWVIPIAGMQPFDIFPDYLLALVIVVGVVDVLVGVLPVLSLFDRMRT